MCNCIEIFSGAGGLAKGLDLAGFHHLAFVEFNKDACATLRMNFSPKIVHEIDIRDFDFSSFPGVDLLAGGPPCQPFSLGGKSKGKEDSRDMFPSAINAIRVLKPRAFIFENVKGLLRPSFKKYFTYILKQLEFPFVINNFSDWEEHYEKLNECYTHNNYNINEKYDVLYFCINAADYGVPQQRHRVFIVGFRSDLGIKWYPPSQTHSKDALDWSKFITYEYWTKHSIKSHGQLSKEGIERLNFKYGLFPPETLPWVTIRDSISDLFKSDLQQEQDFLLREGAKEYPGHTGSDIDAPSKTIKAGSHGVPGGENMIKFENGTVRYMSIAEAKRLQTFPDDYVITGSWTEAMRQLGNAVPVKLAELIAKSILSVL